MFAKVLIANRGEIALRVARACRELGIASVAVHSSADAGTGATRFADECVRIGPAPARESYLYVPSLIEAAHRCGADAVHPGYGFLSEDPDFAEICAAEGLTFIGPDPAVMAQVGDKAVARRLMAEAGLPLLPGVVEPVHDVAEGAALAAAIGYPVILKAVAGGGGRGMSVVARPEDFAAAFVQTAANARAFFGNPSLYLERFLSGARHVEVQVLCDQHGNGIHLGERDCSVQRRHQKLVEESPSRRLDQPARARLGQLAVTGALAIGFTGAGTLEFLLDDLGRAYFMELNARIQVEHPVTELRTGIDLVREQILISAGRPLGYRQGDVVPTGAAIECRINAEDPTRGFAPAPGPLTEFSPATGPWTRVDTGYRQGDTVPCHYDSLLAKLVVWAPDREQAIARMDRALSEFQVAGPGVCTTIDLHRAILRHPVFRADAHCIQFLEEHLPALVAASGSLAGSPLPPVQNPFDQPLFDQRGATAMSTSPASATGAGFSLPDLMAILTTAAGLDAGAHTADPQATLEEIGLDSLAFLALQTELNDRYGFELAEETTAQSSLGEMARQVDQQLGLLQAKAS